MPRVSLHVSVSDKMSEYLKTTPRGVRAVLLRALFKKIEEEDNLEQTIANIIAGNFSLCIGDKSQKPAKKSKSTVVLDDIENLISDF